MKKVVVCLLLLLINCNYISYCTNPSAFKTVGSLTSPQIWVYLCGLLTDFIPDYMEELKVLDVIGKQLDIRFLVMIPKNRCLQFNNCLYWPQDTQEQLLQTYQEITQSLQNQQIQGYIGFSNGGFFLNKLAQYVEINKPIISIGAASPLFNRNGPHNTIYLLIGKKDQWHYKPALNFYDQSNGANFSVHLIEHDEGHIIPGDILNNLVEKLTTNIKI